MTHFVRSFFIIFIAACATAHGALHRRVSRSSSADTNLGALRGWRTAGVVSEQESQDGSGDETQEEENQDVDAGLKQDSSEDTSAEDSGENEVDTNEQDARVDNFAEAEDTQEDGEVGIDGKSVADLSEESPYENQPDQSLDEQNQADGQSVEAADDQASDDTPPQDVNKGSESVEEDSVEEQVDALGSEETDPEGQMNVQELEAQEQPEDGIDAAKQNSNDEVAKLMKEDQTAVTGTVHAVAKRVVVNKPQVQKISPVKTKLHAMSPEKARRHDGDTADADYLKSLDDSHYNDRRDALAGSVDNAVPGNVPHKPQDEAGNADKMLKIAEDRLRDAIGYEDAKFGKARKVPAENFHLKVNEEVKMEKVPAGNLHSMAMKIMPRFSLHGRWTETNNSIRKWEQAQKDVDSNVDDSGDLFSMFNAVGESGTIFGGGGENAELSDRPPNVAQVLVLTVPTAENRARLHSLLQGLDGLGLGDITHAFDGVDAHQYQNEAQEMAQDIIPMSPQQRAEWLQTTTGVHKGLMHQTESGLKAPDEFAANGALACSLGHHHLWELASATEIEDPHAWTIILEDDAHIRNLQDKLALQRTLAMAPSDVHLVHLDDRHCKYIGLGVHGKDMDLWASGSTAYAVTNVGAKMLLSESFSHLSDHWLNVPVHNGKIKALCPGVTKSVFQHEYKHDSTIDAKTPPPSQSDEEDEEEE